jgi:hypothetical protein
MSSEVCGSWRRVAGHDSPSARHSVRNAIVGSMLSAPRVGTISEELFYRVQSVLSGRVPGATPPAAGTPRLPTTRLHALQGLQTRTHCSKCRFANARPEPDFR